MLGLSFVAIEPLALKVDAGLRLRYLNAAGEVLFDAEERMLRDEFGLEYERYAARTKRLVPGVW